ncbi:peptide/nickel transport system permease protein/glutathione transport system permease protein/oligopeptide transport system permease protein [Rhizobiales bacterium GAS191]|nr:peptide/nickel transport system permease protein/glutathione transport system permease protein/oligopeptide transport system permease protein [Rhizobiales bacterium GAS191]
MGRYVASRLLVIPPIVFGVVTILFLIFKMVPGDEATLAAGATATQAEIEMVRHQLGLDRSLLAQYAGHLIGLLRGDFGYSTMFRGNPLPHILERVPATLILSASAIAVTIVLGIPAGIYAASRQNRWPDMAVSGSVVAFLAVPNFWLGMVLIATLSVGLGWLPSFGFNGAASLVMPTLALAARLIALIARLTRGLVIEEMRKPYVRTALAKGLGMRLILWRHVLPNALIPTITALGLEAGYLLGGSVVVERLFAWPGIGDLLLSGIGVRDYTLILAITVLFAIGFLLVNLVVDLICLAVNPRLRNA